MKIQHWRVVIGRFNGGSGGTSTCSKVRPGHRKQVSTGYMASAVFLAALLLSPLFLSGLLCLLPSKTYNSNSSSSSQYSKVSPILSSSCEQPYLSSPIISELTTFSRASPTDGPGLPRVSRKKLNQQVRAITGNRSNRGIKLAHWNAGSAHLHNKMDELEQVVLGVSEANFKLGHSLDDVQLQEYDLVLSKTFGNDSLGVSRVVCYKHQSMVSKVREDLMDDNFSSIWLELGLPRKKKFLVCQLYREWQYMGQADSTSRSIPQQLERWSVFLDQWKRALDSGKEVIVMGDFNLNHFKFTDSGEIQPLVDLLIEQIYPHGVQQCVRSATRSWPGQDDSCLDLIYTNTPEKIGQAQALIRGSSDHRLIFVNKHAKNIREHVRYVKKRSYKDFKEEDFMEAVNNIKWYDVYCCQDVDLAVDTFTNKITEILDRMAPVRKFQVRTKYAAWVSDQTKEKIKIRDAAQLTAATTQLEEDWRKYKRLRNDLSVIKRKE